MRRLSVALFWVVALFVIVGCDGGYEARLKLEVEKADRACPSSMGMLGDVLKVKYDDNAKEVQLYFSLNDDLGGVSALKDNEAVARQSLKLALAKGEATELLDLMVKAGAGLAVNYESQSSDQSFQFKIGSEELKEINEMEMSNEEINKILLDNQIMMENIRCPYEVGPGMEMVRVFDDGDNVNYFCRLDDEIYDIEMLRESAEGVKQSMEGLFGDPAVQKQIEMICTLNKGFMYQYFVDVDKDGLPDDTVDIMFTPAELERFIVK